MQKTIDRRLGQIEQALWLQDRSHPLHFALTAQVSGDIEPESLVNALDRLQQRHPLLRVGIVLDRSGHPHFIEERTSIPLQILPRQGAYHWEEVVEQALAQPFPWTKAPLIRVVLLHSTVTSELIVICHHAIADGLSAVNLIRDLLSALGTPDHPLPPLSPPPSLETLLSSWHRRYPAFFFQTVLARLLLWLRQHIQKMKPSFAPLPFCDRPRLQSGSLSPEMTTALIQRCQLEETTVHAALCTAFLFAIGCDMQLNQDRSDDIQPLTLNCFSPINVRPYLSDRLAQDCGLYISPARTTHALTADITFWEVARSLKSQLMNQVTLDRLLKSADQLDVLMSANPNPDVVREIFTENCGSDLMMTNLGRLDLPQQFGNVHLKALYGPAVLSGFQHERVVGVATLGDRLFFTFVYSETSEFSSVARLPDQAIQLLKAAIERSELSFSMSIGLLSKANQTTLDTAELQQVA